MFPYTFDHKGVQYTINKEATSDGYDYVSTPVRIRVSVEHGTYLNAEQALFNIEEELSKFIKNTIRENI